MANTKKQTSKTDSADVVEVKSVTVPNEPVSRAKRSLKAVPLTDLVCVKSCFYGTLVYVSRKTGSVIEWNEFDSEQYVSVDELLTMRNTQPAFFKESWVRLVGENADEVFAFLQLDRYCKGEVPFDDFRELFDLPPAELQHVVSGFSASLKESVARYAAELILSGALNEIDKVRAIENETGFKLMD